MTENPKRCPACEHEWSAGCEGHREGCPIGTPERRYEQRALVAATALAAAITANVYDDAADVALRKADDLIARLNGTTADDTDMRLLLETVTRERDALLRKLEEKGDS